MAKQRTKNRSMSGIYDIFAEITRKQAAFYDPERVVKPSTKKGAADQELRRAAFLANAR
jgi:hypothetical protein